jgi:hypothetical protein
MASNDNDESFLDLSYVDENTNEASAQSGAKSEPEDTVDFYDDDFDPNANAEQTMVDAPTTGAINGDVKSEQSDQTIAPNADQFMNKDHAPAQDAGNSKKRKDRDDDEYGQTQSHSVSQTPRPTSSTPMQQTQSFGQLVTQALDIKQLPHEITEETIREWANVVNAEGDIVELKFDEFKPNGKSKG